MAVPVVLTEQLDPATRRAVRLLVDHAFGGRFSDEDWAHALGGVHALVRDGADVVAHGSVVPRTFLHAGRTLRVGYVEAVAVHPARHRSGLGSAVVAALEGVVRERHDVGALSATDAGAALYRARGWQPWRGSTWALAASGRIRTAEDDDAVFVLPGTGALDLDGELTCDWRSGDLW